MSSAAQEAAGYPHSFSAEQEQFRDVVRRFLEHRSPTTAVRGVMASEHGYDADVWETLSTELALPGLLIPETLGGGGFGPSELALVMEEMGRALLCAPYLGSAVLGAGIVLEAGSDAQREALLPDMASGKRLLTFAMAEQAGAWDPSRIAMRATRSSGDFTLDGTKDYVLDGNRAHDIVVSARLDDGTLALFLLTGDSPGLEVQALDSIDATRRLARLTFTSTPASLLGAPATAADAFNEVLDLGAVALASEMVGGAQALLDSAVSYAKLRVQFGRTIGSFQAIKHKCADLLLAVESARSAAYTAAEALARKASDRSALASLAKAAASDAYLHAARETIQIHGGIGFTWENDTHLYFKRAKCSELLLGTPAYHRERMLRAWEI